MNIHPAAIKRVLTKNRTLLAGAVDELASPTPDIYKLTMNVEKVISSMETLEALIDAKNDAADEGVRLKIPDVKPHPIPAAIADVQDDNPDIEDKDIKQGHEESRSFFGR